MSQYYVEGERTAHLMHRSSATAMLLMQNSL
jgi:hypothetical protein